MMSAYEKTSRAIRTSYMTKLSIHARITILFLSYILLVFKNVIYGHVDNYCNFDDYLKFLILHTHIYAYIVLYLYGIVEV